MATDKERARIALEMRAMRRQIEEETTEAERKAAESRSKAQFSALKDVLAGPVSFASRKPADKQTQETGIQRRSPVSLPAAILSLSEMVDRDSDRLKSRSPAPAPKHSIASPLAAFPRPTSASLGPSLMTTREVGSRGSPVRPLLASGPESVSRGRRHSTSLSPPRGSRGGAQVSLLQDAKPAAVADDAVIVPRPASAATDYARRSEALRIGRGRGGLGSPARPGSPVSSSATPRQSTTNPGPQGSSRPRADQAAMTSVTSTGSAGGSPSPSAVRSSRGDGHSRTGARQETRIKEKAKAKGTDAYHGDKVAHALFTDVDSTVDGDDSTVAGGPSVPATPVDRRDHSVQVRRSPSPEPHRHAMSRSYGGVMRREDRAMPSPSHDGRSIRRGVSGRDEHGPTAHGKPATPPSPSPSHKGGQSTTWLQAPSEGHGHMLHMEHEAPQRGLRKSTPPHKPLSPARMVRPSPAVHRAVVAVASSPALQPRSPGKPRVGSAHAPSSPPASRSPSPSPGSTSVGRLREAQAVAVAQHQQQDEEYGRIRALERELEAERERRRHAEAAAAEASRDAAIRAEMQARAAAEAVRETVQNVRSAQAAHRASSSSSAVPVGYGSLMGQNGVYDLPSTPQGRGQARYAEDGQGDDHTPSSPSAVDRDSRDVYEDDHRAGPYRVEYRDARDGGHDSEDEEDDGYEQWLHGAVKRHADESTSPLLPPSSNPRLDALRRRKAEESAARKAAWEAARAREVAARAHEQQVVAQTAAATAAAAASAAAAAVSSNSPPSAGAPGRVPSRIPRPNGSTGQRPTTADLASSRGSPKGVAWVAGAMVSPVDRSVAIGVPGSRSSHYTVPGTHAARAWAGRSPAGSAEAVADAIERASAVGSPSLQTPGLTSPAGRSMMSGSESTSAPGSARGHSRADRSASSARRAAAQPTSVGPILPSADSRHGGSTTISNKARVVQALQSLCLAGPHRAEELHAALNAIKGATNAKNFLVLLASSDTLTYRGLYTYEPHVGTALRIHGHGPASLTGAIRAGALAAGEANPAAIGDAEGAALDAAAAASAHAVDACYKYSTSGRTFVPIPTRVVTITTDAVSLKAKTPVVRA